MVKKIDYSLIIILIILMIFSMTALAQNEDKENIYEGKEFRNPFVEYVEPAPEPSNNPNNSNSNSDNNNAQRNEPVITFEDIKREIPFSLDGIITSGNTRIAVVNTGDGVEFVRSSFEKDNYYISAINQDSIIINNRGVTFQLRIGGEINER